jgi:cell division septation protein DedD
VPEPRTHYQVSFTSRQAVLLFVVVLAALTGAYFLGLVTGLAGRQPAGSAAVSASAAVPTAPAAEKVSPPVTAPPAAQEQTPPPAVAAREPGKTEGLQFFEDRSAETTPVSPAPSRQALAPAKAAGGFWVQTLSTKSEREAKSRRAVLSGHGYRAIVESARGAGGPILYRVRVGPFASREEASKAAQTLERKEKAKTWIVPPGE